jgi:hypothetical protein
LFPFARKYVVSFLIEAFIKKLHNYVLSSAFQMVCNLGSRLKKLFLELNLFKKSSSDEQTLPKERLATRIYVCLLVGILVIIAIVAAFILRAVEKTKYAPSHTTFSQLARKYPKTLHCPCSKSGITYNTFASATVNFHQVCSSEFIQQTWIDSMFTNENISMQSIDDFRVTLGFFWQTIAGICVAGKKSWDDCIASFGAARILSPSAVAEEIVRSQVQASLNSQIALSQATLTRTLLAIRRMTSGNQMVSALQTNFYLRFPPEDFGPLSSPKMSPRMFNNCSCLSVKGCSRPATSNGSDGHLVTIPGMIMDCLIVDATLASTLQCYYNQTCLSLLHQLLPTDIQVMSNRSNKHFSIHSTIQMLSDKMMIDEITSNTRFDLYYYQCNPAYCSYSYTRRFDVLFIFTTIIGIFGGLSFVIRLIAPFIAAAILRRKNRAVPPVNLPHVMSLRQNRCKLD